ncbi:MAG: COG3650 family protein [Sphingomonadaceae bacterium]
MNIKCAIFSGSGQFAPKTSAGTALLCPLLCLMLAACQPSEQKDGMITDHPTDAFSGISADEIISFAGTEPFWGGTLEGDKLRYTTSEDPDGTLIAVRRFNGNNGMGLSGELDGQPFRMAITPGKCSDGMSDRNYPYTVTLNVTGANLYGCAWTNRQPYSGEA